MKSLITARISPLTVRITVENLLVILPVIDSSNLYNNKNNTWELEKIFIYFLRQTAGSITPVQNVHSSK